MPEVSREFKAKLFSDLLRAMDAPGTTVSLQEGQMQFPGAPSIQVQYANGDGEGKLTVIVGTEKAPGDWTLESKVALVDYAAVGEDGMPDGVIAEMLRSVATAARADCNIYSRGENGGPTSVRMTFNAADTPAIRHLIDHMRLQVSGAAEFLRAGEFMAGRRSRDSRGLLN